MTEGREHDPAGDRAARTHTRFVILAAPRTGSNLLCTLLDAHSRILCHHEILNRAALEAARAWRFEPATRAGQLVADIVEQTIRFELQAR